MGTITTIQRQDGTGVGMTIEDASEATPLPKPVTVTATPTAGARARAPKKTGQLALVEGLADVAAEAEAEAARQAKAPTFFVTALVPGGLGEESRIIRDSIATYAEARELAHQTLDGTPGCRGVAVYRSPGLKGEAASIELALKPQKTPPAKPAPKAASMKPGRWSPEPKGNEPEPGVKTFVPDDPPKAKAPTKGAKATKGKSAAKDAELVRCWTDSPKTPNLDGSGDLPTTTTVSEIRPHGTIFRLVELPRATYREQLTAWGRLAVVVPGDETPHEAASEACPRCGREVGIVIAGSSRLLATHVPPKARAMKARCPQKLPAARPTPAQVEAEIEAQERTKADAAKTAGGVTTAFVPAPKAKPAPAAKPTPKKPTETTDAGGLIVGPGPTIPNAIKGGQALPAGASVLPEKPTFRKGSFSELAYFWGVNENRGAAGPAPKNRGWTADARSFTCHFRRTLPEGNVYVYTTTFTVEPDEAGKIIPPAPYEALKVDLADVQTVIAVRGDVKKWAKEFDLDPDDEDTRLAMIELMGKGKRLAELCGMDPKLFTKLAKAAEERDLE